jgi:hypothetical protein
MVKPVMLLIGAIPIIFAILIAIPMVTQPEIPRSAVVPEDQITIEYTKHQLKIVSFGVTERAGSEFTEILIVKNDGEIRYSVVEEGFPQPEETSRINKEKLKKLTAIIKETGFMQIPTESFPVREDVEEYQKSTIKVTLNGKTRQIHWPEQNATDKFIPPIITLVELELDQIINQLIE